MPWIIDIKAQNSKVGVTCADVIDQLSDFLYVNVGKDEYNSLPDGIQVKIRKAYYHHRNIAADDEVPGRRMEEGLLRADFLMEDSMFMGLEYDDKFVKERFSLNSDRSFRDILVLNFAKRDIRVEKERLREAYDENKVTGGDLEGRKYGNYKQRRK